MNACFHGTRFVSIYYDRGHKYVVDVISSLLHYQLLAMGRLPCFLSQCLVILPPFLHFCWPLPLVQSIIFFYRMYGYDLIAIHTFMYRCCNTFTVWIVALWMVCSFHCYGNNVNYISITFLRNVKYYFV